MATRELAGIAFGDLGHEMGLTRAVLARLPADRLGWTPHAKSKSLGALGAHVANILRWGVLTLRQDSYDLAGGRPFPADPQGVEDLLGRFDANLAELEVALAETDDDGWRQPWALRHGEHQIFSQPRLGVFRGFVLSHMIHHRAQLGVYLRLLGQPVPAVYGPSADEQ